MPSNIRRCNTEPVASTISSRDSGESYESHSTVPTSVGSPRPSLQYAKSAGYRQRSYDADLLPPSATFSPRISTETYASSDDDGEFFEEPEEYIDEFEDQPRQEQLSRFRPATTQDFADYFPSTRRLYIRHDDTTSDGNMNLRVEINDNKPSHQAVQLFHMRMHELRSRKFSLRRYGRDSGREVCHSTRRIPKPASKLTSASSTKPSLTSRPSLQRTVSNAFASFRGKPELKRSLSGALSSPRRQDSGYQSADEDDNEDDDVMSFMSGSSKTTTQTESDSMRLEFSNYAQVDVTPLGTKSSKRYEFEYWGHQYSWKRSVDRKGHHKSTSFHLIRSGREGPVAQIVPELRTPAQVLAEEEAGGWISPMMMWINDSETISNADVGLPDVIIATGLIALIDDSLHHRSKKRPSHETSRPTMGMKRANTLQIGKLDMEYVGPKALMGHMFGNMKRRGSGDSNSLAEHSKHSPLRYAAEAY